MTQTLTIRKANIIDKEKVRNGILAMEDKISSMPGAMFGDDVGELKHSFGEGLYIRELTVPKGLLIVTKIHKKIHPFFLLKGDCSILTDEGIIRIKAPFSGITKAGTKRVVYTHEDTVWTTCHLNINNSRDLKEIESRLIAKTFEDVLPTYEEILQLTEEIL